MNIQLNNNQKKTTVSIITPAYNAGRFIAETIKSVQNQTFHNWELIVIDDNSQDDTGKIVQELIKQDRRIRLIQLTNNVGNSMARNVGLKAASGRYIAFLDSDDIWLPEKLKRQLTFMSDNNVAFSFTQYRHMSVDGKCFGDLIDIPWQLNYRTLLKHNAIGCLTVVIDREKTGPFFMLNNSRPDFILWLNILKRGFIAYGLHEDLARYRLVNNSVSRNKFKAAYGTWEVYRKIESLNYIEATWFFLNYSMRSLYKNIRARVR